MSRFLAATLQKGKLKPECGSKILEAILKGIWENNLTFEEQLAKVVEFYKVHDRLPEKSENQWVYDQRRLYEKVKLAPERVAAILEAIPIWTW